jgi:hypothetical protein
MKYLGMNDASCSALTSMHMHHVQRSPGELLSPTSCDFGMQDKGYAAAAPSHTCSQPVDCGAELSLSCKHLCSGQYSVTMHFTNWQGKAGFTLALKLQAQCTSHTSDVLHNVLAKMLV